MATAKLKDQDRLDEASKFGVWKARMQFLLDEHGLETFKKEMAKTKRMVLDGIQDHIILHIEEKATTKDMWDVIVKLYQDLS